MEPNEILSKIYYYLKFLSIRSLLTGKRTRRDILIVIAVFIIIRLVIYGAMYTTGLHPMSFLNHV